MVAIHDALQKNLYVTLCVLSALLTHFHAEIVFAQDPSSTLGGPPAGQATNTADNIGNQQPVSKFYDQRTGQLYGRYIIYEPVPVTTYHYQEVIEKQWVPEWVMENKLTTQTNNVPIVTYQLQLQNTFSLNPFAAPQPRYQYVPVVQYISNNVQVNQPIKYQKYVEKEFKKLIPVLKTEQQQMPKYVDRPIQPNETMTATNPNGTNTAWLPIRPLNSYPINTMVQPAPQAYYANNTTPGASAPNLASMPAYNANGFAIPAYSGYNSNGWVAQNRVAPTYTAPQYINNPYPNAGLPNYGYPNAYSNAVAARPAYQMPSIFSRTGSLFQGGLFNSTPNNPGTFVASNPMATSRAWGGTNNWLTNPPLFTGNHAGDITFRPTAATNYSTPANSWNITPVNNYRDPSQTGIPASVLR